MPDVRFGIDASSASRGAEEFARSTQKVINSAREAQEAISRIYTNGAASPQAIRAAQQQEQAIVAQTQATQKLAQTQKDAFATADRVLKSSREELSLRGALYKALQSQDAAQIRAAQSALTALSTLGGANRALSQRVRFEERLRLAIEAGIVTERQAIEVRKHAEVQFSTAAVKARDLRTNMAGLNQSVAVIASSMGRFNPILGQLTFTALRAGNAITRLGSGFALLGPMVGILTAAAAGMTALAVAGDRTGNIRTIFGDIVAGAGEMVKRISDAVGASRILLSVLESIRDALPTPQDRVQAARTVLAQAQENLANTPEVNVRGAGIAGGAAFQRRSGPIYV